MKLLEMDIQRFAGWADYCDFYANGEYITTLYWSYDPDTQMMYLDGDIPVIADSDLPQYGFDPATENHFMGWGLGGPMIRTTYMTPAEMRDFRVSDAYDYTNASAWVVDGSPLKDGIKFVDSTIDNIMLGSSEVNKVIFNGVELWRRGI
jgi:hypothetical protein